MEANISKSFTVAERSETIMVKIPPESKMGIILNFIPRSPRYRMTFISVLYEYISTNV